jgi:hypothetical protein
MCKALHLHQIQHMLRLDPVSHTCCDINNCIAKQLYQKCDSQQVIVDNLTTTPCNDCLVSPLKLPPPGVRTPYLQCTSH